MRWSYAADLFVSVVACASLGWALSACSSLNTTEVQCLSEAECLAKGPAFANTTCSPVTKTCVAVDAGVGTCSTNQDCITANNNLPAICRPSDKTCVVLQTPECPDIITTPANSMDQVANDNTIVLGNIGLQNDLFQGVQFENILRLVQSEFSGTSSMGLPPANPGGSPRPVIWVSCNEFNLGRTGFLAGANHLALDIQVPLIVGVYDSGDCGYILQNSTMPAGTLLVSPTAIQSSLIQLPGNPAAPTPIFWRVSGDDAVPVGGLVQAVSDANTPGCADCGTLRQRLVDEGIQTASEKTRMLIVQESDVAGQNILASILAGLTLNGLTGSALVNDSADFQVVTYGNPVMDPVDDPDPTAQASVAVQAALGSFKPHIIVYAVSSAWSVPYVVVPVEAGWPTTGQKPPLHVSSTAAWLDEFPFDPVLASRSFIEDIAAAPSTPALTNEQTAFFTNYNSSYGTTGPASQLTFANLGGVASLYFETYDSFYFGEFILAAMGNEPLTGVNAANAAANLLASNGPLINDDPADIVNALTTLESGKPLTINGLSGVLNFNKTTGAPLSVGATLYCLGIGPFGAQENASGVNYSAVTKTSSGTISTMDCPLSPTAP
jgi:hypothetical protein